MLVLELPVRIDEQQARWYAAQLQLTASQTARFNTLLAEYAARNQQIEQNAIAPLENQSRAVVRLGTDTREGSQGFARMMKDRGTVVSQLDGIENEFWSKVIELLNGEKEDRLSYVRLNRERSKRADLFVGAELPEARVDLAKLVQDISDPHAEEVPALVEIMLRYHQVLVPALREKETDRTRKLVQDNELMADMSALRDAFPDGLPDDARQIYDEILSKRKHMWGRQLELARRIKQINLAALAELEAALPKDLAEQLRSRFNQIAYPDVYPNPSWMEGWIHQVSGIPSLTQEQREGIEAIWTQYTANQAAICKKMEKRLTRWHELFAEHGELPWDEKKRVDQEIDAMKVERAGASTKLYEAVLGLLTPDQKALLPKASDTD